jgi:hypothetical protein
MYVHTYINTHTHTCIQGRTYYNNLMTFLIFLPGMFVLGEHNTMRELNDKVSLSFFLTMRELNDTVPPSLSLSFRKKFALRSLWNVCA